MPIKMDNEQGRLPVILGGALMQYRKDKNGNDNPPPKICYNTWVKKELEYINNKLYAILATGGPYDVRFEIDEEKCELKGKAITTY